jgi:hypothetical protein
MLFLFNTKAFNPFPKYITYTYRAQTCIESGKKKRGVELFHIDHKHNTMGVFDFVALQGLAGQPGPGQP